jgi:KUP system potassium uptake protein
MSDEGRGSWRLVVGATGVVFGDIGTSPLYAFRESFIGPHGLPLNEANVVAVLSMLIWALVLVVTVKYVTITMRADNQGEGGSFALLALISRVTPGAKALPWIAAAALAATGLFYGDAMITPAISILSAVEGLALLDSRAADVVIPATLAIVLILFSMQRRGTGVLGAWFGPVMVGWFVVILAMGLGQIVASPSILKAASPLYALQFVRADPLRAFFTLGTVVLAITGAEALYADMGHFGRRPISRAWLGLALPSLICCYAGQSALVLSDPAAIRSPFYLMAPNWSLPALIVLASLATVIASQSIISGAFSVTQQAVRLGYLPRLTIRHTSGHARGQVFAPTINVILLVAVVGLVLAFRSSSALAAAFGLAVTATMVLTTLIIGYVVFRIWRWNPIWAVPIYATLLILDLGLFAASTTKFLDGGWLPISVAALVMLLFSTWRRGQTLVAARLAEAAMPDEAFIAATRSVTRVEGTAVYLTGMTAGVPSALLHNLKHNHVLHEQILLVTVDTALEPVVPEAGRLTCTEIGPGLARVRLRYGFMERPTVPDGLAPLRERGYALDPMQTSYFLSRQSIAPSRRARMVRWRQRLFGAMMRNAEPPGSTFGLPVNRVVELGGRIEI